MGGVGNSEAVELGEAQTKQHLRRVRYGYFLKQQDSDIVWMEQVRCHHIYIQNP